MEAATALRAGALVAFPTETVYGLGADATNGLAIAALYRGQRPPELSESPDRSRRAAQAAAALERSARRAAGGLRLAGPADPRSRQAAGLPRGRADDRGSRYDRRARPRASRRPGVAQSRRRADRRTERQSLRPCQPDHGGPCGGRPRRPRGHDPRRRAGAPGPGVDRGRRDGRGARRASPWRRRARGPLPRAGPTNCARHGRPLAAGIARNAGTPLRPPRQAAA